MSFLTVNPLNPRQKRRFRKIRKTQGVDAARDWRRNIQGRYPANGRTTGGDYFGGENIDPDAERAGNAQMRSERETAYLNSLYNRPNQNSAYGSRHYVQDPNTGQWTINDTLAPGQQNILQGAWGGAQNRLNAVQNYQPFMPEGLDANRQRVESDIMGRFERLNSGQFQQQNNTFRQRMADQGLQEGSDEYNRRYQQEVVQPQTLARQEAMSGAVSQGLGEQQGQFNMGVQARQLPFQEMNSLMNIPGQIQNPNYVGFNPVNMNAPTVGNWGYGFETARRGAGYAEQLARLNAEYQLKIAELGQAPPPAPPLDQPDLEG